MHKCVGGRSRVGNISFLPFYSPGEKCRYASIPKPLNSGYPKNTKIASVKKNLQTSQMLKLDSGQLISYPIFSTSFHPLFPCFFSFHLLFSI